MRHKAAGSVVRLSLGEGSYLLGMASLLVLGSVQAASGPTGDEPVAGATKWKVTRRVLAELEPDEEWIHVQASPDLTRWAALTTFDSVGAGTGGGSKDATGAVRVRVDGKLTGLHGHVPPRSIAFEPGSQTGYAFASVAWRKDGTGAYRIVRDGQFVGSKALYTEAVEVSGALGPWYSPCGKHLAWMGSWNAKLKVVLDGKAKKGPGHDSVSMRLPWTADSRLAYVERDGGRDSLIVQGEVAAQAEGIEILVDRPGPSFAAWPLAWVESEDGAHRLHLGDRALAWSEAIGQVAFCSGSAGQSRAAWTSRDGSGWRVHQALQGADGSFETDAGSQASGGAGNWQEVADPAFDEQCSSIAFLARDQSGWRIVADSKPGPASKRIDRFTFASADRIVAIIGAGARRFAIDWRPGAASWSEIGSYEQVSKLVAGPHGRFAMSVVEAGSVGVALDGALLEPRGDEVRPCSMTFSRTSGSFAFVLRRAGSDVVVLDGSEVGRWDRVICPLALDGSALRIIASTGPVLELVTVLL